MSLTIRCHQLSFSSDKLENLETILHRLEDSDADLDVFPEYAMGLPPSGLTRRFVLENAETVEGEFVDKILDTESRKNSSVVFTAFLREEDTIYNAAILAEKGTIKALYKKIHLFDAFGYKESELFAPGRKLAMTELQGFHVGLAICFDLRFPEFFRTMAYRGVNVFIVPSGWYKGEYKLEQWQILVRARAHENTSYLVAVDQTLPSCIGHSMIATPLARPIIELGEEPASFMIELKSKVVEQAKNVMPILSLSKPSLYRELL